MAKQPFVPVSGVIRFRYVGSHQGTPWVNGFAAQYQGAPPSNAALASLATLLRTIWTTEFAGLFTTQTLLTATQVWDLSSAQGANGQDTTGSAGTVTASTLMPVQSAVVISWPVQDRWRGGHFRTYAVARNLADIQNGRTLVTATINSYQTQFNAFRNAVNSATLNTTVIVLGGVRYFPTGHDANGNPLVKTSGQFRAFNPPLVHTRLDTQRRRLGKELV